MKEKEKIVVSNPRKAKAARRTCKDCRAVAGDLPPRRPAPHPGPRCSTHWRAEQKRRQAAAHENWVQALYSLGEGDYSRLYDVQGRHCAICQRATGRTRRLSVDHNHETGEVRGLLCRPCNTMLGRARDSAEMFQRAVAYLLDPPARAVLRAAGYGGGQTREEDK